MAVIVWPAGDAHAARYAAMVVDGHTGKVLHSRHGDAKRYPASLTKIMTLYLLFDEMKAGRLNLSSRLKVSAHAAGQPPSKVGLKPGQTISVSDAIGILVTKSANDVAAVVAENIGGTEANFAKMMTDKARKIGMRNTVFKNASGLPDKEQVTTARDMITLANRLMFEHPQKYSYFNEKYFRYKGSRYRNHNTMLFNYEGMDGIKTGYIRASGFNLLANVRRDRKHLIAVVFGGSTARKRNAAMRSILDKALRRASVEPRKPVPLPTRKPVLVASASASGFPESAEARAVAYRPRQEDVGSQPSDQGMSETVASLPPRQRLQPQVRREGGFHIQVGAYSRETDARARLAAVQEKAGDVIKGHAPLSVPVVASERYLYRARFAGFTRTSASDTCDQLKQRAITCVVMSAD